jgi:hypothetical protein
LLYIKGMMSAPVIVGEIRAIAIAVTSVKLRHPALRDPFACFSIGSWLIDLSD